MSLSERIRPNSEAAPWVINEVQLLELKLLEANIRIKQLTQAIENLRDQKGRHNTEIAYNRLMEMVK